MAESKPFTKKDALVRTKRLWLFVVGSALMFAPAALPFIAPKGHAPSALGLLAAVLAYFVAVSGTLHAWNRWWREKSGELRADENELRIGERTVVRRSSIRHAHVLRRDGKILIRLGRMLRLVDVEVTDEAEGEALLAAMRLDAARSVAHYPMTHGTWRGSLVRALGAVVPLVIVPPIALFAGFPLPLFLAALSVTSIGMILYAFNQMIRVSVGADGVRIRHLLQRPRFVPFSAIEEALTDGRDITLRLADGEKIVMHHPAGKGFKPLAFADRAEDGRKLVERIEAQVEAHRTRANADATLFARAGRETAQWVRDVVRAGASDRNEASYRTAAVPSDALWRIVENAAAPATARAGAAVALRGALDEEGRVRLRATADACAAPKLRVALEAVASRDAEDERELCGVLDGVEDQPVMRARSR